MSPSLETWGINPGYRNATAKLLWLTFNWHQPILSQQGRRGGGSGDKEDLPGLWFRCSGIMELIPAELIAKFKEQGYTGNKLPSEIQILCKLFNPIGASTWYLYEMIDENTYMCFANLGDPQMAECGSVSISELNDLILSFGLTIERDLYFGDHNLHEVIDTVNCFFDKAPCSFIQILREYPRKFRYFASELISQMAEVHFVSPFFIDYHLRMT